MMLIGELTLEQIAEINDRRCAKWHQSDKPWTPERWVTAIVGELGEMANITKKLFRAADGSVGILNGQTIEELQHEEEKEWADTMLYMILFASARGFDMSGAIREVFNAKSEQLGFEERL
jgi:NTP pyrophosphatase (non-canonical NTP hydrolase)